jgi:hypothetical protein
VQAEGRAGAQVRLGTAARANGKRGFEGFGIVSVWSGEGAWCSQGIVETNSAYENCGTEMKGRLELAKMLYV